MIYIVFWFYYLGRCDPKPLFSTILPPEWPERPGPWTLKGEKFHAFSWKKKKGQKKERDSKTHCIDVNLNLFTGMHVQEIWLLRAIPWPEQHSQWSRYVLLWLDCYQIHDCTSHDDIFIVSRWLKKQPKLIRPKQWEACVKWKIVDSMYFLDLISQNIDVILSRKSCMEAVIKIIKENIPQVRLHFTNTDRHCIMYLVSFPTHACKRFVKSVLKYLQLRKASCVFVKPYTDLTELNTAVSG